MNEIKLGVDLTKYPTLVRFSNSPAFIRILIGPAGSLKTSWCFNELLRLACLQEPDAEGVRRTRWVVIRNTFEVLKRATMETARLNIPEPLVRYTEGNTPKAVGEFALPDGTTVDLKIEFLAVDSEDVLGKLLGYDYTGAILDEVSELSEEIILAAARRAGRYPPKKIAPCTWYGAFGATNGPVKSHWLYNWYKGGTEEFKKIGATIYRETGRPFFELFQQPAALIRPAVKGGEWLPNPLAENIDNLPGRYTYYYNMLQGDDQKVAAYVEGKFADLVTGKLVFPEFDRDRHIIDKDKIRPLGSTPIMMGMDFGRTPAVLIAAETVGGNIIILKEVVGDNVSIDALFDDKVIPLARKHYPYSKVAHAWGDPAGSVGGQATEASPFSILRQKNIPVMAAVPNNHLDPRLDAVKFMLTQTDSTGRPRLLISSECTHLIAALGEFYIYEKANTSATVVKDVPTKSHVGWASDIADALQYLCLGVRLRGAPKRKATKGRKPKGKIV